MDPSYIAGFFDGEGCVSAYCIRQSHGNQKKPQLPRVKLTIGQRKPEVLYQLQEYLGYGGITHKKSGAVLQIYAATDVMDFIRRIYPYSVVKREELRLGFQLASLSGTSQRRRSREAERWALHDRIRRLKHGNIQSVED